MEQQILNIAKAAIEKSMMDSLTGYNGPLTTLCAKVIEENNTELYKLIRDEFSELISSEIFKASLRQALNDKLAKVIIGRMGGELESKINDLKADPTTRAKITVALSKMIDDL